jgi:hypothetical protein
VLLPNNTTPTDAIKPTLNNLLPSSKRLARPTGCEPELRLMYDTSLGLATKLSPSRVSKVNRVTGNVDIKENSCCPRVDVDPDHLLVFLSAVIREYYRCDPIDRESNGIQIKTEYKSPGDSEILGSISITVFSTTSSLHIQGSSYILWLQEHLPELSKRVLAVEI